MAPREFGRILTRIWSDPEFRARTPEAQRLYILVVTQKSVNNAGIVPLQTKKWARGSVYTSPGDLEKPLGELHEKRFLVVDEETDEVLIRSFIRNDNVWRQPNVLKNALREARSTESPALRSALVAELRRIESWLPTGKGYEGVPEELRTTVWVLNGGPLGQPSSEPSTGASSEPSTGASSEPSTGASDEPSQNEPSADGSTSALRDPSPNPKRSRGVGEGVGEGGKSPAVGLTLGGSRARSREAPGSGPSASGGPPPPHPPQAERDPPGPGQPQPCGEHHDRTRNCWRCAAARQVADQTVTAEAAERADAARRRRECPACDEAGWLEHPETGAPVVRCDHETDPRQQLAAALDEPS